MVDEINEALFYESYERVGRLSACFSMFVFLGLHIIIYVFIL